MNLIRSHRLIGIQLEQQILHSFRIDWEFVILAAVVLQLRALGVPEAITGIDERGEESSKCLCFDCGPVCEVTELIKPQTNVISDSSFAVNILKSPFCCPSQCWPS